MLDKQDQAALIAELARQLEKVGSWSGATHLQKCVYFLQERHGLDLGYEFVIHHYGPFSFELDTDLASLRRREILATVPESGYGVHYRPGPNAPELPPHLSGATEELQAVAETYGEMGVQDLEVHATTRYVASTLPAADRHELVEQVRRIKPHITHEQIEKALESAID